MVTHIFTICTAHHRSNWVFSTLLHGWSSHNTLANSRKHAPAPQPSSSVHCTQLVVLKMKAYVLCRAALMNPGYIEKAVTSSNKDLEAGEGMSLQPSVIAPAPNLGRCESCAIIRPLRSKHCQQCDRWISALFNQKASFSCIILSFHQSTSLLTASVAVRHNLQEWSHRQYRGFVIPESPIHSVTPYNHTAQPVLL